MHSALEDVEFLARSASRVVVLDSLREAPRTRDELTAVTDVSRTTLSRMLADFEDRGWLIRRNGRFESTAEGRFVASEVTRLLENMETAEQLNGTLAWLPTESFEFDLRSLRDAEVVTLRWNDPASMRLLAEHLKGASRVRSIATAVSREVVDILHLLTVEGDASYEGILTPNAIEVVRAHPELRGQLREILESDGTTVYRSAGEPSLAMVMLIDDRAAVCNHGSGGPQMEAVLSDDEAFRSWVESYFESVREDAVELEADTFVA